MEPTSACSTILGQQQTYLKIEPKSHEENSELDSREIKYLVVLLLVSTAKKGLQYAHVGPNRQNLFESN